jgi:hypothetical protein
MKASRSEHDLNLAILYAVQFGFRYSASLFLPDLRCRPLGGIMLRAFKATRRPSFEGDSVGRKLIGSGRYSKRFFSHACLPDLQSKPAILRVIARTEHSLQSKRVVRR